MTPWTFQVRPQKNTHTHTESPRDMRRSASTCADNGYRHLQYLGRGQFGSIHLVQELYPSREEDADKLWILKQTDLSDLSPSAIQMTMFEAEVMGRLAAHPYIATIRESFYHPSSHSFVIVMEYYEGGDLFSVIEAAVAQGDRFSEEQILKW